jgi:tRNA1(Val) A37 N6-methylase TrmN6
VLLRQPRVGYRAATDPVLLAAAVPARAGEVALDLGCGVGAAGLCLIARVPGVRVVGLEVQPAYAALARANGAAAEGAFEVVEGDLASPPAEVKARAFDHVLMNPPFHPGSATASPDPGRDRAHRETLDVSVWIEAGLKRLRPGGRLTIVHRAERLGAILAAMEGPAGAVRVLPLAARAGRAAKRVIVQGRKGAKGPLALLAPLVMHAGERHVADRDDFTEAATAVLRDGAALDLDALARS